MESVEPEKVTQINILEHFFIIQTAWKTLLKL